MKIAVILAAYNGEKYIKEQLESILNQHDVSVDILVFDDASTDSTVTLIENFTDRRIKLTQNAIGTGSAANNFFKAIKELPDEIFLRYDYISLSDQDDIWLPNKLKEATETLLKNGFSLYGSNLILWDEKSNSESIINRSHPQKKYDYLFESGSAGCTYVFTTAFSIELKKAILKTEYLEWKFFSHDWFIYFFARINGYTVFIDSNPYIKYRMHSNNLHGFLNKKNIRASIERLKVIQAGWYPEHIKGFRQLLQNKPVEEKIYQMYTKSYFTRLFVLFKYNFELNRSFKKNIQFFIISAIPLLKKHF